MSLPLSNFYFFFALLSMLIGAAGRANIAYAFTYPSSPTSPERSARVDDNLFRTYYREIDAIRAHLPAQVEEDSVQGFVSKITAERNTMMLQAMHREVLPSVTGEKTPFITREQANDVLESVKRNPVAGGSADWKYDDFDRKVGFCFGRAAFVHLELLRRGVAAASIGKIFAIGYLHAYQTRWDFHVTTVVRGPGSSWWAIDDLAGKILTDEEWANHTATFDHDPLRPTIRYYFTDAVKFQPAFGAYGSENLYFPFYGKYFRDLATWFDAHPATDAARFHPNP